MNTCSKTSWKLPFSLKAFTEQWMSKTRHLKVWRAVANTFSMHYKGNYVDLNMQISLNTPFINRIVDQERLRTWTMVFRSDHVLVKIHKLKLTRQNTYILSEAYQKCKKKRPAPWSYSTHQQSILTNHPITKLWIVS